MKPTTLRAHRASIRRAHAHLATHLDGPPDLAALARLAGVSPRQLVRLFTRSFQQRFGHTPAAARSLLKVGQPPASRRSLWQLALAGGLRPHVEQATAAALSNGSSLRRK